MNVFELRRKLIEDYQHYVTSFISIRDRRISGRVTGDLEEGLLWPEPSIALNPAFAEGAWVDDLVAKGTLHPECGKIFRIKPDPPLPEVGLKLHRHQLEAVEAAQRNRNYVLTTGTGSGKSLAYIVPIVDHVLRSEKRKGIKAIVVYPMNALANSQFQELQKFLCRGYPDGIGPVTFRRYTGQESDEERQEIIGNPPDILLTNYVMLELILTRTDERQLVQAARGLRFLVLDELHTYRGRQGADVALLVRRTRNACEAPELQHVGTSATMATGGSFDEQQREVARVASLIFGASVEPGDVIGETLRRATRERDTSDRAVAAELNRRVADRAKGPSADYDAFVADPLSSWIESTFGLSTEEGTGRLVRAHPRPLRGAEGGGARLAALTGVDEETCVDAIQRQLLGGYGAVHKETGFPAFAFRLHQFISRGDAAYATLEPEATRHITVHPQQFVPDDRDRRLFPLAFCRECGQEYYTVRRVEGATGIHLEPRSLDSRVVDEDGDPGFVYINTVEPWDPRVENLPDDWIDPGPPPRVKYHLRKRVPREERVDTRGAASPDGLSVFFVPAPFRFCLHCGVAYRGHLRSDFAKLGTLGSEGRSTATTILSLSLVRHLKRDEALKPEARKLLSFTDNRQDASLQAGHFNDFVEVGLLRSALYRAARDAGSGGLTHERLTQAVFEALDLPFELYAAQPDLRPYAREDTHRTLREVLGYRLYHDLRRGWRISSPNLEQTGLLTIEYEHLQEVAEDAELWAECHSALAMAAPDTRAQLATVLLDHMRRELATSVDFLDEQFQERLKQNSAQRLRAPWNIDENEDPEHATIMLPRAQRDRDYRGWVYLSARGGFGQYLGRVGILPHLEEPPHLEDRAQIICDLMKALTRGGLLDETRKPEENDEEDRPGYQVKASAMKWRAGDGTSVAVDPIRIPRPPQEGSRPNRFFLDFYQTVAADGQGLEAREHTAQVAYEAREDREERFREGRLPILYCSPTMELGVDIASLNVVNLRNVPPTPANYAQRSGRAGRSGQPALVVTYCSGGSPHDQYFFRRPYQMVSGQVAPPRLDLANEDLVRAHAHAIWLAETGMSLGRSLTDLLDLEGDQPSLHLKDSVQSDVDRTEPRERARQRAEEVLADVQGDLEGSVWWGPTWLDDVFATVGRSFEDACERWRSLYRSALGQYHLQSKIIGEAFRKERERNEARKLRREAEAQLELLRAAGSAIIQSDFYSYRYFASEGFLPGYSFPRLPLSAFIPARRSARGEDEFLSRPRFLAISEFGPRNFIYHEGSRYIINRVILPVAEFGDPGQGRAAITTVAKVCQDCGYLHPSQDGGGPDLCDNCRTELAAPIRSLFRLQNVTTRRRDRINSDEEERQRMGYDLQSTYRFATSGDRVAERRGTVEGPEGPLAALAYGHAATIWRINKGWKRRREEEDLGFLLDMERGYWAKDNRVAEEDEPEDELGPNRQKVVPFVEDHKNCLLFKPEVPLPEGDMASLQAALKSAIQVEYQLEDSELASEPLPSVKSRWYLLLYESAEGGAGVLRRLVEDPGALARVAARALEVCHFDPVTGADLGKAPGAREKCEAACYDCLMSYTNQPDHLLLDRKSLRPYLQALAQSEVKGGSVGNTRETQFEQLSRQAGSELERRWLRFLMDGGFRLPAQAQRLFEEAGTRPDFVYGRENAVVYVDGPAHDNPDRARRDADKTAAMEDLSYVVVRFHHEDDWRGVVEKYPWVFGGGK